MTNIRYVLVFLVFLVVIVVIVDIVVNEVIVVIVVVIVVIVVILVNVVIVSWLQPTDQLTDRQTMSVIELSWTAKNGQKDD